VSPPWPLPTRSRNLFETYGLDQRRSMGGTHHSPTTTDARTAEVRHPRRSSACCLRPTARQPRAPAAPVGPIGGSREGVGLRRRQRPSMCRAGARRAGELARRIPDLRTTSAGARPAHHRSVCLADPPRRVARGNGTDLVPRDSSTWTGPGQAKIDGDIVSRLRTFDIEVPVARSQLSGLSRSSDPPTRVDTSSHSHVVA
jgi:hypothetical protein